MLKNTLLDKRIFEKKQPVFAPGVPGNPRGRPQNYGSITYWLKQLLAANEGKRAVELASKIIEQANGGSLSHQTLVLDRIDGAVASEANIRGIMVHIGDEYASQGLDAIRKDIEMRHQRSLLPQSPQELTHGLEVQNLNKGVDGKWGVE